MFRSFLTRYSTPLTVGLFLVSAVSGMALFFHFQGALFHGMHEWLSMLFLLPVAFHLVRNRNAFLTYFKKGWMAVPVAGALAAAIIFALPALTGVAGERRPPQTMGAEITRALTNARIADLAPVFGQEPAELMDRLRAAGISVPGPDATLAEAAGGSRDVASRALALLPKARGANLATGNPESGAVR